MLTGHDHGLITLNIEEADDAIREMARNQMDEVYRTVLGHFRHEIGHYYWDQLIKNTNRLQPFRKLFGDETTDYAEALKQHYNKAASDSLEREIYQCLCQCPSLGRLGRNLGALHAYH